MCWNFRKKDEHEWAVLNVHDEVIEETQYAIRTMEIQDDICVHCGKINRYKCPVKFWPAHTMPPKDWDPYSKWVSKGWKEEQSGEINEKRPAGV